MPGFVVALVGLMASYGWWQYQSGLTDALSRARFERQARAATHALQQRVEAKGDLLLGLRGLLIVNPQLSRSDFERVAAGLQLEVNHVSVRNLHFTRAVAAAERNAFVARARANVHLDGTAPTDFTIHPDVEQPEYFVVDYVWPRQGNEEVQGLEVHSQPANLEGLLLARATGALVVSAPFRLVQQDGGPATAVNIRLPVFSASAPGDPPRFLGAVGTLVNVRVMAQGLRERGYLDGLRAAVTDIGPANSAVPRPGSPLYEAEDLPAGGPRVSYEVAVGGRLWRVDYALAHPLLTPNEARLPLVFALGGLVVTALLTTLVALLVRRRLQAVAYAELAGRAASESESRFRSVFNQAAVGMAQIDSERGHVVRANRYFCDLLGYGAQDLPGLRMQDISHPDDLPRGMALLARLLSGEIGEYRIEKRYRRKDGSFVWVDVTASAMHNGGGSVRHHIVVVQDITQRRQTEQELRYLAYNDLLTGLPNRRLMIDRLEQAVVLNARHQTWGAVLLLDLDHFKTVNETRGHEAGDQLLREAASRLRGCVEGDDTLARQGGDEFVAVLRELGTSGEDAAARAEEVAQLMLAALRQPFELGGPEPHHITLSVGVTVFDGEGLPAEELVKRSELAMYEAKAAGRNTLRFFDPQMQAAVAARVQLEGDIRTGLAGAQFELYYQPKMADGRIQGAEALLRWRHPERGFIPPAQFIPLAEDTGLILQLGDWVLHAACTQLAAWSGDPLLGELVVAVNVSPRQFRESGFVAQVLHALASTGAQAHRLRLELTEGMLLQDVEGTIAKMVQLRGYGVGFSLDDFGTGYSSLAYLKRLPLHELKIDQSFVRDVLTDPNDAAIARTIIALGSSMGLQVVAEGVETEAQRAFLERHGCRVWQGYLLAPALPREQFEALVARRAASRQ
ncbi:bifunctional diguanylate cyclase/phosphodiesterase [Pulveribacter suum]|uniref:bifunctional diguanylate cyclase/phosphodiesterase n=1 Tax=Pulveribacter suum TaxID=2116657 RepID=UPI0029C890B3|nr:EAL domain-containing protein [Pulveribacter suum]